MEQKFYPKLNFIGHLETAQWDIKRLLNKLHPHAWEKYGNSGWGKYLNETMFESTNTIKHATSAEKHLLEYYTKEIELRARSCMQVITIMSLLIWRGFRLARLNHFTKRDS